MDISLKALEEALAIRRQIEGLEKRLFSILKGSPLRKTTTKVAIVTKKGGLTAEGRRKLSQLMKARWAARRKGTRKKTGYWVGRSTLTPAGQRRLSQAMKARWAARRKSASHVAGFT